MRQAVEQLFDRYERLTNAALAGAPDMTAVCDLYEDAFIGSSPTGVMAGRKDESFAAHLAAGFAHNREIGARRMEVLAVRVDPIDAIHALAHVDWRASYDVDGRRTDIDFTNVYLTRLTDGQAKVFGWITGDEAAELSKHGVGPGG